MRSIILIVLLAVGGYGAYQYDQSATKVGAYTPARQVQPHIQVAPKPRAKARPTAAAPQGTPVPKRVRGKIMSILRDVENIRGLQASGAVDIRFISRDDFSRRTKMQNKQYWTVSERTAEEKTMVAFGFTSARTNFRKLIEQDTGDYVLGMYEPDARRLFVVGDEADMDGQAQSTMAHELTHALQDQHHNLKRFTDPAVKNSDRSLATAALIEGDAMLSESQYQGKHKISQAALQEAAVEAILTSSAYSGYEQGPPLYGLTVYFPYVQGTEWVKKLHARGGWQQVDSAYKRPPESTEQILHPEKYFARERPVIVEAVNPLSALPNGWKKLRSDTLGEYRTLILLSQGAVQAPLLKQAATGWGGDSYAVYAPKSGEAGSALVWESVWDTEADASEFTVALAALQAGLNQNVFGQGYKKSQGALSLDGADASVRIRRSGKRVVLVVTNEVSPADTDRVLAIAMR